MALKMLDVCIYVKPSLSKIQPNGGFQSMGYPQIIHLFLVFFHYKLSS